jgi:YfiH family protein
VRACTTTRAGGLSVGPYRALNLATHVGDDPAVVESNRRALGDALNLPEPPRWLEQRHHSDTIDARRWQAGCHADAIYTNTAKTVCAILSADCLPILIADPGGDEIAAIHAGWRGLLASVIGTTIARFAAPHSRLAAWIGPGICQHNYPVGPDLRRRFTAADAGFEPAFLWNDGSWYADLAVLADRCLRGAGISDIYRYRLCTFDASDKFFSYRRDGQTGRMATLIWRD